MHIFVEIRYMDHGLNIEKNETIKILRPGSYWQEFTVLALDDFFRLLLLYTFFFMSLKDNMNEKNLAP